MTNNRIVRWLKGLPSTVADYVHHDQAPSETRSEPANEIPSSSHAETAGRDRNPNSQPNSTEHLEPNRQPLMHNRSQDRHEEHGASELRIVAAGKKRKVDEGGDQNAIVKVSYPSYVFNCTILTTRDAPETAHVLRPNWSRLSICRPKHAAVKCKLFIGLCCGFTTQARSQALIPTEKDGVPPVIRDEPDVQSVQNVGVSCSRAWF